MRSPKLIHLVAGSASCIALVGALAHPAYSQDATSDEVSDNAVNRLGTITVTSRFREESANDVGQTINVLDADALVREGIENFEDVVQRTPGLDNISQGPGRNLPVIRGITSLAGNDNNSQSNGNTLFFDEVVVSGIFPNGVDVPTYDLNRIEVLKGPQPTYFGEGSMGGSVRYFSQDPDLSQVGYRARAEVSSTEDGGTNYIVDGSLSFPIINDKMAARVTVFRNDQDGFIDNDFAGVDNVNTFENTGFTGVLLYEPNDVLTWRLSGFHQSSDVGNPQYVTGDPKDLSLGSVTYVFANPADPSGFTPVVGGYEEPYDRTDQSTVIANKISLDLGSVTLQSVTGYYDREYEEVGFRPNLAFSAVPIVLGIPNSATFDDALYTSTDWTQEFRVITDFEGPLNFIGGIYYADTEFTSNLSATTPSLGQPPLNMFFATDIFVTTNITHTGEQISYFGEAQLSLLDDRLRLAAGARHFDQEFVFDLVVPGGGGVLELPAFGLVFDSTFYGVDQLTKEINEWLPRFQAEFDLNDDVLIYGSVAKGARNGLFNNVGSLAVGGVLPGNPLFEELFSYDPDSATSWEAGFKASLLDSSLQLNASAFYTDFENLQAQVGLGSFSVIDNIGDVEITGLDVELVWQATESLTLFASGNLTNAELANDLAINTDASGVPTVTAPKGTKLPQVAPESFYIGIENRFAEIFEGNEVVGSASYTFTGDRLNRFGVGILNDNVDSLSGLNLRLGIENERWSLFAFAENATNEIETVLFTPEFEQQYVNRPRTIGLVLRVTG